MSVRDMAEGFRNPYIIAMAKGWPWGTYGKGGMEAHCQHGAPLPEVRWVRLGDCSTNHLRAIIQNVEPHLERDPNYVFPYLAAHIVLDSRGETACPTTSSSVKSQVRRVLSWIRTTWSTSVRRLRR